MFLLSSCLVLLLTIERCGTQRVHRTLVPTYSPNSENSFQAELSSYTRAETRPSEDEFELVMGLFEKFSDQKVLEGDGPDFTLYRDFFLAPLPATTCTSSAVTSPPAHLVCIARNIYTHWKRRRSLVNGGRIGQSHNSCEKDCIDQAYECFRPRYNKRHHKFRAVPNAHLSRVTQGTVVKSESIELQKLSSPNSETTSLNASRGYLFSVSHYNISLGLTDAFPSLLCILSAFVFIYELLVLGGLLPFANFAAFTQWYSIHQKGMDVQEKPSVGMYSDGWTEVNDKEQEGGKKDVGVDQSYVEGCGFAFSLTWTHTHPAASSVFFRRPKPRANFGRLGLHKILRVRGVGVPEARERVRNVTVVPLLGVGVGRLSLCSGRSRTLEGDAGPGIGRGFRRRLFEEGASQKRRPGWDRHSACQDTFWEGGKDEIDSRTGVAWSIWCFGRGPGRRRVVFHHRIWTTEVVGYLKRYNTERPGTHEIDLIVHAPKLPALEEALVADVVPNHFALPVPHPHMGKRRARVERKVAVQFLEARIVD
ncbi:hypothetical protein B0H14DRAFT_2603633 [Mycena olivaceomarginata]|nr:hypothetical protein B0H14DRAFT_2603633 [Mycena olivaceomarginata]